MVGIVVVCVVVAWEEYMVVVVVVGVVVVGVVVAWEEYVVVVVVGGRAWWLGWGEVRCGDVGGRAYGHIGRVRQLGWCGVVGSGGRGRCGVAGEGP